MRTLLLLICLLATVGSVLTAEDLGGGAPASGGLVPELVADNWVPFRTLNLVLGNTPPHATQGIAVIGVAPTVFPLPGNVGTLRVSLAHPHLLVPVGKVTPLFMIPPALEGTTFYIQALVFDSKHPAGGVLSDATRVDIFTPMILQGNTRQSANNIKVIDIANFNVVQTVGSYRGGKFVYHPDRKRVYVCEVETNLNRLAYYTIANGRITFQSFIPLSGGTRYHGDITRDGKLMYVPLHDGIAVVDVDPSSPGFNKEIRKLRTTFTGSVSAIFTGPMDCTLTPDGKKLYVAYGETTTFPAKTHVGMFDLSLPSPTEKLIQVTTGGTIALGGEIATRSTIESSADGRFVATVEFGFTPGPFSKGFQNGGLLNVIDTHADREVAAVPAGGYGQMQLAFDRMGRNIYVAQTDKQGIGEVIRVDADRRHLVAFQILKRYTFSTAPYSASTGPQGVDTTPDGSEVYVTVVEDGQHATPEGYRINTWLDKITGGPLTLASLPANIELQQR